MLEKLVRGSAFPIVLSFVTAGCLAESQPDEPGAIEQAGTASQDAEVLKLRAKFSRGSSSLNGFSTECSGYSADFAPAVGYRIQDGNAVKRATPRKWSCVERNARKDSPQDATPVTYAFDTDGLGVMTNTGSGFGKVFTRMEARASQSFVLGSAAGIVTAGLVTNDIVRSYGVEKLTCGGGVHISKSTLVIERVLRPAVQELSVADQATFDALNREYETAVSASDLSSTFAPLAKPALALAYVSCESFEH